MPSAAFRSRSVESRMQPIPTRDEAAGPMDVITTDVSWENRGESLNQEQDSGSMVNWVNIVIDCARLERPGGWTCAAEAGDSVRVMCLQPRPAARQSQRRAGPSRFRQGPGRCAEGIAITLVPSADQAQLTVEIVNREERDSAQGGFGGKSVTSFRDRSCGYGSRQARTSRS